MVGGKAASIDMGFIGKIIYENTCNAIVCGARAYYHLSVW